MIAFPVSPEEEAAAKRRAAEDFRREPSVRATSPRTRWVGYVGEDNLAAWAARWVKVERVAGKETGAPDLAVCGVLVDAKTLHRNVPPRPYYWGYAYKDQTDAAWAQEVFFCSYDSRSRRLFLCGGIGRTDLLASARLFRRGETIPPDLRAREDVYALRYSALEPPTNWLHRLIIKGVPAVYVGRR